MSEPKTQPRTQSLDSREALIDAAKRVFAVKGYDGATVKDLSDAAGVNVSLVSYHFGGKEGLYRTCLTNFGEIHVEMVERLLGQVRNKEDFSLRLRLFAEELVAIHHRDNDTCRIIYRGMETLDPITTDVFKKVFYRIFEALHKFMRSAQKAGIIREDLDPELISGFMFGSLVHTLRAQETIRLLGKKTLDDASYRSVFVEHWVSCFTNGIFLD